MSPESIKCLITLKNHDILFFCSCRCTSVFHRYNLHDTKPWYQVSKSQYFDFPHKKLTRSKCYHPTVNVGMRSDHILP